MSADAALVAEAREFLKWKPPFEDFQGATCRGAYMLGTACNKCEKCTWERGKNGAAFASAGEG